MFAFELLLMLTVVLPLTFAVLLLVSVADWQPAAASAKAAAAAAKTPLVTFTRRMKVFSSLVWQRWSTRQIVQGDLAGEEYHKLSRGGEPGETGNLHGWTGATGLSKYMFQIPISFILFILSIPVNSLSAQKRDG